MNDNPTPLANKDGRPPGLSVTAGSVSVIHDRTPVCMILNTLNRKCVDAAKLGDYPEAQRVAGIAGRLEDAVREAAVVYRPERDDAAERHDAAYSELLFAVCRKFDGESRHQTALRYIREAEEYATKGPACDASSNTSGEPDARRISAPIPPKT